MDPQVSIIIPTYNEENNMERFQAMLDHLKGNYEVIFSDGFSEDGTYERIRYPKLRKVRYRSNQMNEAAKVAKGEYLLFIHADSILSPDAINEILSSNASAGCFRLRFDTRNVLQKIVAFHSNLRVTVRNIAFGDQGIFIKRELFREMGGYRPLRIMEDYELSICLKEKGYRIKLLKSTITTSARRFERNGILKTIIEMQVFQHRYRKARRQKKVEEITNSIGKKYEEQG